jgi:hypothetical protein
MSNGPYTQAQILLIKAAEDEGALHVAAIRNPFWTFMRNRQSKDSSRHCYLNYRSRLS